jgi:hypothetical protein
MTATDWGCLCRCCGIWLGRLGSEPIPSGAGASVVLDPFAGSGTTLAVVAAVGNLGVKPATRKRP